MDAVEILRPRNRFEEELPSGLRVTLRKPRIRDCIIAGRVPLPVLDHMLELGAVADNGKTPEVSDEETVHMQRFQNEIVKRSIVGIEGQEVEMSLEAVEELEQEDYDHVVAWATRKKVRT